MSIISNFFSIAKKFKGSILLKLVLFVILQLSGIGLLLQHLHFMQVKERNFLEIKLQQQNLVLKETLLRAIDIADNSIDNVRETLGRRVFNEDWDSFERYSFLKGYINNTVPMLMSYSIYDEYGDLYANSYTYPFKVVNVLDRQYFKDAAVGRDRLYFGPYYGRVIDRWSYSVVRRLSKTDGSFNGVLIGTMGLHYFAEFCKDINISEGTDTYILSPENQIIMQCGYTKIVTENISKKFFDIVGVGKFTNIPVNTISTTYSFDDNILLISSLPGHSGLRIATVTSSKLPSATAIQWQHNIIYMIIALLGLSCLILYINALLDSVNKA